VARSYLIANPTNTTVSLTATPPRSLAPRRVAVLAEASAEAGGPAGWALAGCIVCTVGEPTGAGSLAQLQDGLQLTSRSAAQAVAVGPIP